MSAPASPAARSWPVFSSLAGYQLPWLRNDVLAGLTVWAVLVPEALAYATVAGVSPVIGLYAAPPALLLYAVFGSSKHLITGPMSATAALSAAAVADLATGGPDNFAAFTAALAIATGVIALGAGLLRLGFLANFISEPVLKGFIVGLALTIIVGQVPKLLGIDKTAGDFFAQVGGIVRHLGDIDWPTAAIGLASLAIVVLLKRFLPLVPGSLVAVLFGIAVISIVDPSGVLIVGPIESGLPHLGLPAGLDFGDYLSSLGAAVGIMLVGFSEGLGAAKTYAARHHYEIDNNRELIGLGTANLGAGLASGMVVNGSLSKTAVNGGAGARTQASGLVVAVLTIVTLLFFTGLFENLPEATLGAVVIAALVELVDFPALVRLFRVYTPQLGSIYGYAARPDFIAAVAAMLGVLIFDTLPGLVIGIGVSFLLLLYRSSRPHVSQLGLLDEAHGEWVDRARHPDATTIPGIVVLRVEGSLYFSNADSVRHEIVEAASTPGVHAVVLDAVSIANIDVTAVETLLTLADDLERTHTSFAIARAIGQVRDMLASGAPAGDPIAQYLTVRDATEALG